MDLHAGPTGVAVDGVDVYWLNDGAGTIVKCAPGGCSGVPTVLITGPHVARGVAVDATSVYGATAGGDVMKLTPK